MSSTQWVSTMERSKTVKTIRLVRRVLSYSQVPLPWPIRTGQSICPTTIVNSSTVSWIAAMWRLAVVLNSAPMAAATRFRACPSTHSNSPQCLSIECQTSTSRSTTRSCLRHQAATTAATTTPCKLPTSIQTQLIRCKTIHKCYSHLLIMAPMALMINWARLPQARWLLNSLTSSKVNQI